MMFRFLFICFFTISTFAQQFKKVDFISCNAFLKPNQFEKSISGTIQYEFNVLSVIDTIKIDAKSMNFNNVMINGKSVQFKNSGATLDLFEGFKTGKNNFGNELMSLDSMLLVPSRHTESRWPILSNALSMIQMFFLCLLEPTNQAVIGHSHGRPALQLQ